MKGAIRSCRSFCKKWQVWIALAAFFLKEHKEQKSEEQKSEFPTLLTRVSDHGEIDSKVSGSEESCFGGIFLLPRELDFQT